MTRRKPPRPAHPASQTPGQPPGQPGRRHKPGGAQSGRPGLLFGLHPVAAAWTNPDRRCTRLLATEAGLASLAGALDQARAAGLERPKPTVTERTELDRLLPPGAVHQGLVLDAAPLPEIDLEDIVRQGSMREGDVIVVLDQVTDPHNVGAILRSAEVFGARAVIAPHRHSAPETGALAKTASSVYDLLRVTLEADSQELKLVEAQDYYANPQLQFEVEAL